MQNQNLQIVVSDLSQDAVLDPPAPALSSSAVHVWELPLSISEPAFTTLAKLLSPDERDRASRFRFEKDARRFTVARASLRAILSGYMLSSARDLRFVYSQHGKPALADSSHDIRFSVSHSGELALFAVARGRDVGVDVEIIREDVETNKLARRYFSVRERESLLLLPPQQRLAAFFRCWTCKEAFLKAQGVGLSRSLESFDVEVDPSRSARLISTRPNVDESEAWFLHDIDVPPGYAAAMAVEGRITEMKILRYRQA